MPCVSCVRWGGLCWVHVLVVCIGGGVGSAGCGVHVDVHGK